MLDKCHGRYYGIAMMTEERYTKRLEQLQEWTSVTEKEIEEIRAALAPLEQRLQGANERLDLLRRLTRMTETEQAWPQNAAALGRAQPGPIASLGGKQDLEAHLEKILREAERPMHISDIRRALVDRAVPLPGRGDEANIIVRLRRAPERFVRTGRGMYAVTALGLEAVPPAKRRRRVTKGRKS